MKFGSLIIVFFALVLTAPASADEIKIDTVTVTATKREENLQDVPKSISVLSDIELEDARVDSVEMLSHLVPNLQFYDWGANSHNFIYMRGLGAIHNEPAVGFYLDGVSFFESGMFNYPLFNLERIEVLRGPQGTLYGRNTIGGVINIITKEPTNEANATIKVGVGDYGLRETSASLSSPLIADKLFLGLSIFAKERDGYQENKAPSYSGGEGDYRKGYGGRLKLRYLPNDDLDISLSLDGQSHDNGSYPVRRLADWGLVGFSADEVHTYSHNYEENIAESDMGGGSLQVNWRTPVGKLTSITAYRVWNNLEINDQDFSSLDLTHFESSIENKQFSQELRLASTKMNFPLKWLAGLYGFTRDKTEEDIQYFDSQAALFQMVAGSAQSETSENTDTGFAVFGEMTYTLPARIDLTFGLRYDREENEHEPQSAVYLPATGWQAVELSDQNATSDAWLPKLSVAWRATDRLMPYITVSRGYRSGGYNNVAPTTSQIRFDPEFSWNYEIGLKSKWMGDRLQINASAFYIDIDDQQLSFVMPTGSSNTYVANAGSSRSNGAELEMVYKPFRGFKFIANGAFTEAKFESYTDSISGIDYAEKYLPLSPTFNYNVAAQYRRPIGKTLNLFNHSHQLSLFARADVIGVGKIYWQADNKAYQSPYELVNFKVGVESEQLDLIFWIKNAFDVEYQEIAFQRSVFPMLGQDGAPRTIGVDLTVRF